MTCSCLNTLFRVNMLSFFYWSYSVTHYNSTPPNYQVIMDCDCDQHCSEDLLYLFIFYIILYIYFFFWWAQSPLLHYRTSQSSPSEYWSSLGKSAWGCKSLDERLPFDILFLQLTFIWIKVHWSLPERIIGSDYFKIVPPCAVFLLLVLEMTINQIAYSLLKHFY